VLTTVCSVDPDARLVSLSVPTVTPSWISTRPALTRLSIAFCTSKAVVPAAPTSTSSFAPGALTGQL